MSADLNVLLQNTKGDYSQLCRKWPPLVHDKGVAYGRWSLKSRGRYETVDCIPFSLPLTMIEAGVGIWFGRVGCICVDIHLANFLNSNLTKFAVIWEKKGQTEEFFPCPRSSKITPTKEKERRKRKSEEEERRRREKSNGCTLTFYNGYFGDFWPKKTVYLLFPV